MSAWAGVLPSPPPARGPGAAILLKWCRGKLPGLPVDPNQALVGHVALEEKYLNGAHKANQTEAPPTGPGIVHPPWSPGAGEPDRAARMEATVACVIWKRIGETESAQQERGTDTV